MANYPFTHIVTCMTPGCQAEGVALPQHLKPSGHYLDTEEFVPYLDEIGNYKYECICMPCNTKIQNIVEYVE